MKISAESQDHRLTCVQFYDTKMFYDKKACSTLNKICLVIYISICFFINI